MLGTPLSSVSGSSTPYADRVFSESASPSDGDEFENDDLDTESSALSSESDFDEAPPKKGGKNKGKSKANGEQLLALGYRLDGLDGDAMPDGWIKPDTEELARRQKQILEERERRSKETKLIKAMEDRLKQKLGLGKKGRLPQSDKNRIRLCLVSKLDLCGGRVLTFSYSTTPSSRTFGETSRRTLSQSSRFPWRRTRASSSPCSRSRRSLCTG